MFLGIDASNIRAGGGVTHLRELLNHSSPMDFGFEKVVIWSGSKTLDSLANYSWLEKRNESLLGKSLPYRIFWQQFILPKKLIEEKCSILFSPGGILPFTVSVTTISMSQNMLPFEKKERSRFKSKAQKLKFLILRFIQGYSFKNASGLIFLSEYAKKYIQNSLNGKLDQIRTIPHGVDKRFMKAPRDPKRIEDCSDADCFRLLYVSIIDVYKHQWKVVEAVALLRKMGLPVAIDFVGPCNPEAMLIFEKSIKKHDEQQQFINYHGPVNFDQLEGYYQSADIFVFASSCENLPNILLEAMAAGLPIASSNTGPMPEVLCRFAEFFNPESAESISMAIKNLILSPELRKKNADSLYDKVQSYSWEKCANNTFDFLRYIDSQVSKVK
ncbi:glycosyltransferase family 4 protein [Desulfoluna spongiiphila]|uniref:Glycosyltransferase involved in cell wall bisynthesis n=1 Tax=Desulfoluna spongiiphila TaxID=419481 RepID=A0A1G5JRE8_9BACT|nr:glycosyltransferase family 1 protein [Desulfoluna spongiiphila]SCY90430.1 Glycosyltransferase involved in cell wall bisynthesis [Desulfoluna spongiiphila]